ncbi:MAG: NAD-dependent epimerase/dehydratase family protein [Actinomycetota bacterium]
MESGSRREDNPNEAPVVVVTGAAGAVGSGVVRRLIHDHRGIDVRAVDKAAVGARPGLDVKRVDLAVDDLSAVFAGATSIVHLATAVTPDIDDPSADELELAIVARVLDAAAELGVEHVCVLSTAMVYGAWVENPVPLTEEAEVRPNPDFPWATVRASVERAVLEWGTGRDAAVSVLRPAAVVTDDTLGRLARVLHTARLGIAADGDPPVQYLHVDDLAAAIVVAVRARFDGVANVAPDGWIPPDALADLEGPQPRVRVPAWAARLAAAARQRAGLAPIPPGIVPYTSHSWVVANDRIRDLGWEADYSNEEAWVVSHDPSPLEQLPARRRQELALAVAAALAVGLVVGAVVAVRRLRRR